VSSASFDGKSFDFTVSFDWSQLSLPAYMARVVVEPLMPRQHPFLFFSFSLFTWETVLALHDFHIIPSGYFYFDFVPLFFSISICFIFIHLSIYFFSFQLHPPLIFFY
jgi:hypothetical protein